MKRLKYFHFVIKAIKNSPSAEIASFNLAEEYSCKFYLHQSKYARFVSHSLKWSKPHSIWLIRSVDDGGVASSYLCCPLNTACYANSSRCHHLIGSLAIDLQTQRKQAQTWSKRRQRIPFWLIESTVPLACQSNQSSHNRFAHAKS